MAVGSHGPLKLEEVHDARGSRHNNNGCVVAVGSRCKFGV